MKWKKLLGQIKAMDEKGTGQAVFATMNLWDKDDEFTVPGSFGVQTAKLVGAHNWGAPNIGMAEIREEGDNAIADFKFYLDMQSAREWYTALLNNFKSGVPQEWSYGFDVLVEERGERNGRTGRILKKIKVHEVSPVMVGAGMSTRTTAIKSYGQLRGTWESTQMAIREAAQMSVIGSREGWLSIEGTYDDAVVVCAYLNGEPSKYYQLSWSMQPSGEVLISDQSEVDLEMIVREKSFQFEHQFARVADEILAFKERCKALAALRAKEGRVLSAANRNRLTRLLDQMGTAREEIDTLLRDTTPADDEKAQQEVMKLFGQWQHIVSNQGRGN